MQAHQNLDKIISQLKNLPAEEFKKVSEYIDEISLRNKSKTDYDAESLKKISGIIDVEPFADKIDDILYGE